MIIDLNKYGTELGAYVKAAEEFIARESHSRLRNTAIDLETGRERGQQFTWKTAKSIRTIDATRYDRRAGKEMAPIIGAISFRAKFDPPTNRRSTDWTVVEMVTHLEIFPSGLDIPALHLHVDKKNAGQIGPELHFQVSEACTERLGMSLAVPRIPAGFLLPTDCLDFVLFELFSQEWLARQSSAHAFMTMRSAQLGRARRFAEALDATWRAQLRRTPISVLQDCSFDPALRLA